MFLGHGIRSLWCCASLTGSTARGAAACRAYSRSSDVTRGDAEAAPESGSLLSSYQRLLQRGALLPDATQAAAVQALQLLQDAVLQREARRVAAEQSGLRHDGGGGAGGGESRGTGGGVHSDNDSGGGGRDLATPGSAPQPDAPPRGMAVRGAYLWGPVGSGKTALMDLFAETARHRLLKELPQHPQLQPPGPVAALAFSGQLPAAAPSPPAAAAAAASRQLAARAHFHEFMQGVHGRLHELQEALPRVVARSRQGMLVYRYAEPEEDPLVTVAREYGSRTAVLCLDEMHVTDVADAMILSRLFGSLLVDFDTTVLFTSNRPPKDLYKGGLSRKYFEPFVRLVGEQMVVLRVAADVDYRRATGRAAAVAAAEPPVEAQAASAVAAPAPAPAEGEAPTSGSGRWLVGPGAEEQLRSLWQQRVTATATSTSAAGDGGGGGSSTSGGDSGGSGGAGPVEVPLAYGRTLKVPCAAGDAAWFTFPQLCGAAGLRAAVDDGGALAAPDFLALSRRFREFYVAGVPQLGPAQRDEARRLVTLLDVAYDNRCRLAIAAAVAPDALFAPLLAEARRQGVNPRLGLPKSSQATLTSATHSPPASSGAGGAAASAFVPTASVTAALHMQLGPSMTHGSALTNSIHPSEFTGSTAAAAAAPFAVGAPSEAPAQPHAPAGDKPSPQQQLPPHHHQQQRQQPGDLSVPPAVLAEEVLMYHRAASRLAEMCRVVRVEVAGGQ